MKTPTKTAKPTLKKPLQITKEKATAERLVKQALGTLQKVNIDLQGPDKCKATMQNVNSIIGMLLKARKELFINHCNECLAKELKSNKASAVKELEALYNREF